MERVITTSCAPSPAGHSATQRAACRLAEAYVLGKGVSADPERARSVLDAAVQAEDADALYLAAELWRDGVGGPRDPRRALRLFELAQLRGRSAKVEIGVLRRELRARD